MIHEISCHFHVLEPGFMYVFVCINTWCIHDTYMKFHVDNKCLVASYCKIHLKRFSYKFSIHLDCDLTFTISFWKSGTFWADGFNNTVAQLDKTIHLIYILGVVQGVWVSLTLPSAIQVKVVSKHWLRIRTQGPRLPP